MSREVVNALKSGVKESRYQNLKAKATTSKAWHDINSGYQTYVDLERTSGITINNEPITQEEIKKLYEKHNTILEESKNYRLFLKKVFTDMFKHANAIVPNDLIIDELITNYNQAGYTGINTELYSNILEKFNMSVHCPNANYNMNCSESDCLEYSSNTNGIEIRDVNTNEKVCDLSNSVKFNMRDDGENVTCEDGKILLTIPKKLESYKDGDKSIFDRIIECFQNFCEKLGFKFDIKIEQDLSLNNKEEYTYHKPSTFIVDADISTIYGPNPDINNNIQL